MEINKLEKNNNLELDNKIKNNKTQKDFLESALGKTINTAIDIGIRSILPEFIDDQLINIKDNLLNYGLKNGITKTIDDAIDLGKSAVGIVTGNFENVTQMQNAVKTGGIIDGVSNLLDIVVDKVRKEGLINNTIAKTIKQGKSVILDNVENNINQMFTEQSQAVEYTDRYINNWKEFYKNKDFQGMEKEYKKIRNNLEKLVPIENTINAAKKIEVLHNLIKNNGQNFNLTEEQIELAKKLN